MRIRLLVHRRLSVEKFEKDEVARFPCQALGCSGRHLHNPGPALAPVLPDTPADMAEQVQAAATQDDNDARCEFLSSIGNPYKNERELAYSSRKKATNYIDCNTT